MDLMYLKQIFDSIVYILSIAKPFWIDTRDDYATPQEIQDLMETLHMLKLF